MKTIKPYIRSPHFYETDQMSIIHHASYIHWFEEARVDFMNQMGYSYARLNDEGIDFGITGITCDYKAMVRFGDTVAISVMLASLEAMRMRVAYKVTDQQTGELRATGESRHFFYDRNKKRPVSLKRSRPLLYEEFLEYVQQ